MADRRRKTRSAGRAGLPGRSDVVALWRNGIDIIGTSSILYQSGDASTWLTTAVWGFERTAATIAIDTALGGGVLFSEETPIYRTWLQWMELSTINVDYLFIGTGGIVGYGTDQTANANRIKRYLRYVTAESLWGNVGALFPTNNISSTITRVADTQYTLDMEMSDGDVFGVLFANPTVYIDDIAIKRPMFSVAKSTGTFSGSWTNATNAGAFGGAYSYTVATGAYVEFATANLATTLLVRWVGSTNAGICLVSIDGDNTLANKLSTAQDLVTAGTLPDTVLVANGGTLNPTDRVLDQYKSVTTFDVSTLIADGLTPGIHVVRLTNTGYKRGTASDDRLYISGFAANVGAGVESLVSIFSFTQAYPSAHEVAALYTPTGISQQWYGTVHNNETLDSFKVFDGGVEQTIEIGGSVTSTSLSIARESTFSHPTEGTIGSSTITYRPTSSGLQISQSQQFNLAGVLLLYQGVFPVTESLNKGSSSGWYLDYVLNASDGAYKGAVRQLTDAFCWDDVNGYSARLFSGDQKLYRIEDRSDGLINKIYSTDNSGIGTADVIEANQIFESTSTWQVASIVIARP